MFFIELFSDIKFICERNIGNKKVYEWIWIAVASLALIVNH